MPRAPKNLVVAPRGRSLHANVRAFADGAAAIVDEVGRRASSRGRSVDLVSERDLRDELAELAERCELDPVGQGKDRIVFGDGALVVKVARSAIGLDANAAEARLWDDAPPVARRWLLPVRAHDHEGRWLVMDSADGPVDEAWFDRFAAWFGGRGDRADMPPRALIESIEHGNDVADWMVRGGQPVLFDYA